MKSQTRTAQDYSQFLTERTNIITTVTPGVAAEWLKRNWSNRPLVEETVAKYANAMVRGEWRDNGDTIRFATTGKLLDGQNRLAAVVKSGVSIRTTVAFGLDEAVFSTIDQGKKRTFGHVLAVAGQHEYNNVAAAVKWLWMYENNAIFAHPAPTPDQLLRVRDRIGPDVLHRSVKAVSRTGKVTGGSGMPTALHYLFSLRDREKADLFFVLLGTGQSMGARHPVLTLRERLMDERASKAKLPKSEQFVWYVRAWNAFVNDATLTSVRGTIGDDRTVPQIQG